VEDELHQVGLKMAADIFEMRGWDSLLARTGCSTAELSHLIDREQPDMLGLSFSVYFHLDTLERMLTALRSYYPDLPILVGGQGLRMGGDEVKGRFSDVTCVQGLEQLDALLAGAEGAPLGP
jgi:methanogenic corrinoid protein MtbC1